MLINLIQRVVGNQMQPIKTMKLETFNQSSANARASTDRAGYSSINALSQFIIRLMKSQFPNIRLTIDKLINLNKRHNAVFNNLMQHKIDHFEIEYCSKRAKNMYVMFEF